MSTDYAKMIKWDLLPYINGEGLDIGCGDARPHDWMVGVDIAAGQTPRGPNHIRDARKLASFYAAESQDFIFSSHLLNELEDWPTVLAGWWSLLKPNGYLILFLPTCEAAEGVKACNPKMVVDAMEALKPWQFVEARTNGQQLFHVFRKCDLPTDLTVPDNDKTVAVVKLGAHGDALWASSVFPHLKEQGFHVILYTQDTGEEVLRHDPHIDRLIKFESRVPMGELGELFRWLETKYKHTRLLVECVEGTLLPSPQKIQYHFPDELRHKLMDFNYLEVHHAVAKVPMVPRQKFYPNDEEMQWANETRKAMQPFVVVLMVSGSSQTKHWPYAGDLAKRLLEREDVSVVVLGEDRGIPFPDHPRLTKVFMAWPVRKALTFVQLANVVVGQETGVLNCVAFERDVKKVVLLTHSSVENLTRDWPNTTAIGKPPKECSSVACHRLHYSLEFCKVDGVTKAPLCQSAISVHDVLQEVLPAITASGFVRVDDGMPVESKMQVAA